MNLLINKKKGFIYIFVSLNLFFFNFFAISPSILHSLLSLFKDTNNNGVGLLIIFFFLFLGTYVLGIIINFISSEIVIVIRTFLKFTNDQEFGEDIICDENKEINNIKSYYEYIFNNHNNKKENKQEKIDLKNNKYVYWNIFSLCYGKLLLKGKCFGGS